MSTIRQDVSADINMRSASQVIATNGTVAFDFGTPNDINLAATTFEPGDRVLVIISALRAAGTTSSLAFTIQDAPDSAGSIGTPASATVIGTLPTMATDSGAVHTSGAVSVVVKQGRPWIRVNAVHGTAGTDSFQCHCQVVGIPRGY